MMSGISLVSPARNVIVRDNQATGYAAGIRLARGTVFNVVQDNQLFGNRMLDAFKDPDSMKKIYDQILPVALEHKPWIKQFWDSADNTKSGLMENDVWIGQIWSIVFRWVRLRPP